MGSTRMGTASIFCLLLYIFVILITVLIVLIIAWHAYAMFENYLLNDYINEQMHVIPIKYATEFS